MTQFFSSYTRNIYKPFRCMIYMVERDKEEDSRKVGSMRVQRERKYGLSNFILSLLVAIYLILVDAYSLIYLNIFESLIIIFVSLIMYLILLFVLRKTNYFRNVIKRKQMGSNDAVINAIVREVEKGENLRTDFVGSSKTKVYHLPDCKLVSKIKPEFKLVNNNEAFFKSKKFKTCKICMKK